MDNHDIIQFNVRALSDIADPEADYDVWQKMEQVRVHAGEASIVERYRDDSVIALVTPAGCTTIYHMGGGVERHG